MKDHFVSNSTQYVDNTTIYEHFKPYNIIKKENIIGSSLNDITVWSKQNSLSTNVFLKKYIIHSKKLSLIKKFHKLKRFTN